MSAAMGSRSRRAVVLPRNGGCRYQCVSKLSRHIRDLRVAQVSFSLQLSQQVTAAK